MTRRLAELLAGASLADRDIAMARAQADRDNKNFATGTDALKALLPAAGQMADIYEKGVDDDATVAAKQLLAENADTTGAEAAGPTQDGKPLYAETPEDMAKRLSSTAPKLAAPVKTGDVVTDFLNDPLGIKSRAAAKAQLAAEQGLVTGVTAARAKALPTGTSTGKPVPDERWVELAHAGRADLIPPAAWARVFPGVVQPGAKPAATTSDAPIDATPSPDVEQAFAHVSRDLANPPGPTPDERIAADKLTIADANAKRAQARANPSPGAIGGGAMSDAARKRKADADKAEALAKIAAMNATAQNANGGVLPAKTKAAAAKGTGGDGGTPLARQDMIDQAGKLAAIYEKGGARTGSAARLAVGPLAGNDLNDAESLSTALTFGVPKTYSKSKRINDVEFKKSLENIVGDPRSAKTNEQKAHLARQLQADLVKMRDELVAQGAGANATMGSNVGVPDSADIPQDGWGG